MGSLASHLIPQSEVARLVRGSFEETKRLLEDAVRGELPRLFGEEPTTASVIATYPNAALVVSQSGACRRVRFETTSSGVRILAVEAVPLQVVTPATLDGFLRTETTEALTALRAGRVEEARQRFAGIVTLVEHRVPRDRAQLAEWVANALQAERPWKVFCAERKDRFVSYLGEDHRTLQAARLLPKFHKLTDGSTPEAELAEFRTLVVEDTQSAIDRVQRLGSRVETAFRGICAQLPKLAPGERIPVTMVSAFAEDLVDDLKHTHQTLTEAVARFARVDDIARVHDTLAESLFFAELAGGFVMKVSNRLVAENAA